LSRHADSRVVVREVSVRAAKKPVSQYGQLFFGSLYVLSDWGGYFGTRPVRAGVFATHLRKVRRIE
jgi:hypothetical protein